MSLFLLEIITPERRAFSAEVSAVTVPASDGVIGVLPRHERLFTVLVEGEVKIIQNQEEIFLAIGGGFMEVTEARVSILVTRAVHADELNEEEIKKARAEAQAILARTKDRTSTAEELEAAQSTLRRSILELGVIRKRRRLPRPLPN
ncbi:ATP synthase F1 subunit epsilon [Patescibacteria group bacterium]|nr:ATP synthase F1 subunit epsilon [Patescibacteria group bacterium]